jgi:ABC-2 type transport system ATP-binding protein
MIKLSHIKKCYKVSRRQAGFGNAVKNFFARNYDTIEALADISFEIEDGETVGYIGPNGAGKSSTIKVMSGILTPDSGECIIDGRTPWLNRREHVKNLGVVFGQRSALWWDVPVEDSFELLRDIYSVDPTEYRKNLNRLTEMLNLGDLLTTPVRQLSLGQRMRCEIAASLIHSPKLLFLDEPTIGLDAVSKIAVREFVSELNRERGTTIILTTHDMQDIEAITKRIILIGKGRILLDGDLGSLRHRFEGKRRMIVEFNGSIDFELPEGVILTENISAAGSSRAVFTLDSCPVSKLISLLSSKVELTDVSVESTSIDDIVLNMYREYGI